MAFGFNSLIIFLFFLIMKKKLKITRGRLGVPVFMRGRPNAPNLFRTFLVCFLEFPEKKGYGKHFPRSLQAPWAWETRGARPRGTLEITGQVAFLVALIEITGQEAFLNEQLRKFYFNTPLLKSFLRFQK